jgi:hypothetical protein
MVSIPLTNGSREHDPPVLLCAPASCLARRLGCNAELRCVWTRSPRRLDCFVVALGGGRGVANQLASVRLRMNALLPAAKRNLIPS